MKGKKTGGRQKGTPNKNTQPLRDWFLSLIDENRTQIKKDLQTLEPKERLQWIEKILPYVLPKVVNAVEVEGAAYTRDNIDRTNNFNENYELITWADEQGKKKSQELTEQLERERLNMWRAVEDCDIKGYECETCEHWRECQYFAENYECDEDEENDTESEAAAN